MLVDVNEEFKYGLVEPAEPRLVPSYSILLVVISLILAIWLQVFLMYCKCGQR